MKANGEIRRFRQRSKQTNTDNEKDRFAQTGIENMKDKQTDERNEEQRQ